MDKLRDFMLGRRGLDALSIGLMVLSLIISIFTRFSRSMLIRAVPAVILLYCLYRVLSRDTGKRQQETDVFMRFCRPVAERLGGAISRMRESGSYKFFRCPECSQQVRVPKGKGKIEITCPKCKGRFVKKS